MRLDFSNCTCSPGVFCLEDLIALDDLVCDGEQVRADDIGRFDEGIKYHAGAGDEGGGASSSGSPGNVPGVGGYQANIIDG